MTPEEKAQERKLRLERLKDAADELNAAWADMAEIDRTIGVWIAWDHRPRKIVLTSGVNITRDVIHE